jgi:hypothetical protein
MTADANYDDLAALIRHKADAQAVLLFVVDGKRGSGVAVYGRGRGALSGAQRDDMMLAMFRGQMSEAEQKRMGVVPRDVPPAEGEVKGLPKLEQHSLPTDAPEQAHLRLQVADEVEAVFRKYDVGGTVLLISKVASAWRTILPPWIGLKPDPVHVLRVKTSSKNPGETDLTLHFIACVREMSSDYANFYGRIWRQVVSALEKQGAIVEHMPLGEKVGVGGRPDPLGGKVD